MPVFLKQFGEVWGRLKGGQRFAVAAAAALTLALVAALVFYGSQPEYSVLFSDLKPEDAQAIVEKLKAANVSFTLTGGGTVVSVPNERVAELRLQMAASGVLTGGHVGFDLFDKASFGATDFTQQVNYQRAISGELARTLEAIDEIESARVHVTQPRESLFADKSERAKASVMIRTRQGRELSREKTEGVINLVASAVEGLDPADVSVMDARGRLLSSPLREGAGGSGAFNSQLEARRKFEAETAARVITLIEPISGPGHVRADVSAELDFSQVEQTEEKFNPQSAVVRSQQTSQETRGAGAAPALGGVSGARANVPGAAAPAPTPTAGDARATTSTNYEIDKTVRRTVSGGGRINRLSVSVAVDYKSVQGVATVRTPDELRKIEELVSAALGVDASRGDQIVVQAVPFDQPSAETHQPTWLEANKELVRAGIKYGALAFVALLLLLFVVRPARRALRAAAAAPLQLTPGAGAAPAPRPDGQPGVDGAPPPPQAFAQAGEQHALAASPRTVAELEAEMEAEVARQMSSLVPEVRRASAIKKQLIERTKKEPEMVAMTVRSWLQEGASNGRATN